MNIKGGNKQKLYDDKEDLEIRRVAYLKNSAQKFLLCSIILLFVIMLGISLLFINNYYKSSSRNKYNGEIIEVKELYNNILINNNGKIEEIITSESFKNDKNLVIEKINTVELSTNKDAKSNGIIKFDVKLVLNNDFEKNEISTNDSDLLVRFSYSYDKMNWTYINNVVRTSSSTLKPLMGNYYDVAGLQTILNISTNFELKANAGKSSKMFWRAEFVIKNKKDENIKNNLKGNFKLEYKDND